MSFVLCPLIIGTGSGDSRGSVCGDSIGTLIQIWVLLLVSCQSQGSRT
jgi:hypothetical protein